MGNIGKFRFLFLCMQGWLTFASFALGADIDNSTAYWSGVWDQCYNVHLEGFDSRIEEFKAYLVKGRNWEKQIGAENAAIDSLVNKTCKAWAADPNGNMPLEDFRKKYAWIYKQAISINDKAKGYLLPKLQAWALAGEEELAKIEPFEGEKATWDMFPCSGVWVNTQARIQAALLAMQNKVDEMKAKCPHGADDLKTVVTTTEFAEGSGKRVPSSSGASPRSGSDITGTQKALQEEKRSKSVVDEQK